MKYHTNETVTFTAQRPCTLCRKKYQTGDEVTVILARDWDEDEGLGEGGPWGWGGYTSRIVSRLGEIKWCRHVGALFRNPR